MVDNLQSCLNHIINYNGMDFIPFKSPIVLSRYDVIHVKYRVKRTWIRKSAEAIFTDWQRPLYFEQVSKLLANKTQTIPWCKRVSLLDDVECFDIEFVDNSPKTKGWSCESHWYLFPPNPTEDIMFYEENLGGLRMLIPGSYKSFWSHNVGRVMNESELGTYRWGVLKTRPNFDIIITQMDQIDYYTMRAWTKSLYAARNGLPKGYTTKAREESTFSLEKSDSLQDFGRIGYKLKNTILFCRHCKRALPFQPIGVGPVFSEKELVAKFHYLHSNTDYIYWTFLLIGGLEEGFLSQNIREVLNKSPYNYLHSAGGEHKFLWSDLENAQYQIEARLLMQAIVGANGSFRHQNWWGINWRFSYWHGIGNIPLETKYNSPIVVVGLAGNGDHFHFDVHPTKLKFVSCGKPLKDGLAFSQLTSIFDLTTWLCISLSIINGIILPSELYLYAIGAKDSFFQLYNGKFSLPKTLDSIVNRTTLHPMWGQIFKSGKPTNVEILKDCNKTALFLPELEAIQTYYKLRQNKTIKNNVYLSRKDLFRLNHRILFMRWMNPKILMRMKGLGTAGIWRWWSDMVVNFLTKVRGRGSTLNDGQVGGRVGESNLSGNISIVFVLLAVGIVSSITVFLHEVWSLIKKAVSRHNRTFCGRVRWYLR
ncbi:unnamed protein product [Orchesella dallaii]|uniref:Uncharacterized protein n=1 Tax=Orchesella dallaii TaxID=48710 RepID=A0ABP1RGI4_9HEXA